MDHRVERVNAQLRQELAEVLRRDVKDPNVGAVGVVAVSCSADLGQARVRISVLGEDEALRRAAVARLQRMAGFLRGRLRDRLPHLRRVPQLRFQLDESIGYAVRVSRILAELEPGEPGPSAEGQP